MDALVDDTNREIYREISGEGYRRRVRLGRMGRVGPWRFGLALIVAVASGFAFGYLAAAGHPLSDFILQPRSLVLFAVAALAVLLGGRWTTPSAFGPWFQRRAAGGYMRDLALAGVPPDAIIRAHLAARTRPLFFNGLLICGTSTAALTGFVAQGDGNRWDGVYFVAAQLVLGLCLGVALMSDVDGFRRAVADDRRRTGGLSTLVLAAFFACELIVVTVFAYSVFSGLLILLEWVGGTTLPPGFAPMSEILRAAAFGLIPLAVAWIHARLWVRHWLPKVAVWWDEARPIVAGHSGAPDEG
jgi:hypothetical protein